MQVDLKTMARSCRRYASSNLPRSPQTAEELKSVFETESIMERFGRNWVAPNETATDFFRGVHIGADFSYAVFASQSIIEMIEKYITVDRRRYLMDATFKICPLGEFTQFLIIQIECIESVN